MASPIQQETSTCTGTAVEPVVEPTVDPSAAVVAALQDLAQEEIDLTAEPDSASYFGQKIQITQLQAVGAMFWRMLRSRQLKMHLETLSILPHMVDGIIEYMRQQQKLEEEMQERINLLQGENVMFQGSQDVLHRLQTDYAGAGSHIEQLTKENQELDKKWRDLETIVIRFECSNQALRIENKRLERELNTMIGISDGDTESDTGDRSKKRSRREVIIGTTIEDAIESDAEDGMKKRVRREA